MQPQRQGYREILARIFFAGNSEVGRSMFAIILLVSIRLPLLCHYALLDNNTIGAISFPNHRLLHLVCCLESLHHAKEQQQEQRPPNPAFHCLVARICHCVHRQPSNRAYRCQIRSPWALHSNLLFKVSWMLLNLPLLMLHCVLRVRSIILMHIKYMHP